MLYIWHEKNMSQQYSVLGKLGFTVSYVCGYVSAPPSLLDLQLHPVFDLTGESLILTRRISWSRLYVFGSFLSYFFSQTGLNKKQGVLDIYGFLINLPDDKSIEISNRKHTIVLWWTDKYSINLTL